MNRRNLLAMVILAVALGGCALLVEYGDPDAMAYDPLSDLDAGESPAR